MYGGLHGADSGQGMGYEGEIRQRLKGGDSQAMIARDLGCSQGAISMFCKRRGLR